MRENTCKLFLSETIHTYRQNSARKSHREILTFLFFPLESLASKLTLNIANGKNLEIKPCILKYTLLKSS